MAVKFDNETVHYRSDGTYLYTTEQEIEALRTNNQFTTIELGHPSDTTLSRVSSGVISVEGKPVVMTTGAQTVEFAAGVVTTPSITTTGDTNTGFWFPAADTLAASTGGSERVRIDSSGNVGIGTASPATKLDVYSTVRASYSGSAYMNIGHDGVNGNIGSATGSFLLYAGGTNAFIFHSNNTARLTIDTGGTLTSQATYDNTAAGSTVVVTSGGAIRRTSSSIKYKKDIEDLDPALSDYAVANLRPVWYRTKTPTGDDKNAWSHIGLIAEEVALVEPRLVHYRTVSVTDVDVPVLDQDGQPVLNEDGNPKTRKERVETPLATPEPEDVNYARLSVILLDVVQRMKADISALRSELDAYKAAHP